MQAAKRDQVAGETGEQLASNGEHHAEPEWLNRTRLNHPHLADIAEQHGRMVEVAILAGNRERALHIIDRAFASLDQNCIGMDSDIASILGERIACILDKARIRTIGDLTGKTRNELLAIRHVGWKTLRKIIYAIQSHGYDLKK